MSFIANAGLLTVLVSLLFHLLPSPLDPYPWKHAFDLPSWGQDWAVNTQLKGADLALENELQGPESFAFHPLNGDVYTGVTGGLVYRIDANATNLEPIFFVGGYLSDCSGNGLNQIDLLSYCQQQTKDGFMVWNQSNEEYCGRPLGMRVHEVEGKLFLFVMDAYHGLFRIDISYQLPRGRPRHLFGPSTRLHLSADMSRHAYQNDLNLKSTLPLSPPKFLNDFDISPDGCVYLTDSSYKWSRSNNRAEIMDAAPRGRLLRYCSPFVNKEMPYNRRSVLGDGHSDRCVVDAGRLEVLMCGLHFPNGVQLINDGNDVVIAETTRFRLIKMDTRLLAASDGKHEESARNAELSRIQANTCFGHELSASVFNSIDDHLQDEDNYKEKGVGILINALPGLPDNIRRDRISGHIIVGTASKSVAPFSLLYYAYQSVFLRVAIGKLLSMKYIEHLVPKYGLVLIVSTEGGAVDSFHDPSGRISMISEAQFHPITADLWMGSHGNKYVGIDRKFKDRDLQLHLAERQEVELAKIRKEDENRREKSKTAVNSQEKGDGIAVDIAALARTQD